MIVNPGPQPDVPVFLLDGFGSPNSPKSSKRGDIFTISPDVGGRHDQFVHVVSLL